MDFEDDLEIYVDGRRELSVRQSDRLSVARLTTILATDGRVMLEARAGEWTRFLALVRDSAPPRAEIELLDEQSGDHAHRYTVRVSFSERVVWESQPLDCPVVSRITQRRHDIRSLTRPSEECFANLLAKGIEGGIRIRGGRSRVIGRGGHRTVYFAIETESSNRTADIEITVDRGFEDFAGNAMLKAERRVIYYRPFPPPKARQDRLLKRAIALTKGKSSSGETVGRVTTVVVAGVGTASLATSSGKRSFPPLLGIALLCSGWRLWRRIRDQNDPSRAEAPHDRSRQPASVPSGWHARSSGMLAVTRMPVNYQNFASELKWTVLDVKTPWEDSRSTERVRILSTPCDQ